MTGRTHSAACLALAFALFNTRIGPSDTFDVYVAGVRIAELTIADNGCGLDPLDQTNRRDDNEHFGLLTMRERAEQVGGNLRIESVPGTGTRVHASARLTNATPSLQDTRLRCEPTAHRFVSKVFLPPPHYPLEGRREPTAAAWLDVG